jgi:iron complex transport system substrate-binding protein
MSKTEPGGVWRHLAVAVAAYAAAASPAVAQTRTIDASSATGVADSAGIVSVGGDITETLYALGIEARIVAVDTTSKFPPRAMKEKKSVGYMRALSTEGVLSVGASLMVASQRSGPPDVIAALKASRLRVVLLDEGQSADDISRKIRILGRLVGEEARANALAARVEAGFTQLAGVRSRITSRKRAVFALSVQSGRITVGGRETSADLVLELAGLANAASQLRGYKPVGEEGLIEMAPDILIIPKPTGGGAPDAGAVRRMSGVSATPAGKARQIVEMDALYLLGLGPRTPAAARGLLLAAYPELASSFPR